MAALLVGFHERAAKAGIPDTNVEVQAAASYTAWQILEAGVRGAGSLDDKAIAAYIKKNRIDTIQGKLRFDGPSNYGDDLMALDLAQRAYLLEEGRIAAAGAPADLFRTPELRRAYLGIVA